MKGRIRQSLAYWCLNATDWQWDIHRVCETARTLGFRSVELAPVEDWHPMKGHPGYQGDDIDYCADIVRQVGSSRAKLLFDIYHVAIMNGDIIRRLRQYGDILGHIHAAGVPGRAELDECQEINYPAAMRAF